MALIGEKGYLLRILRADDYRLERVDCRLFPVTQATSATEPPITATSITSTPSFPRCRTDAQRNGYGFGDNYYYRCPIISGGSRALPRRRRRIIGRTVDIYDLGTWADIKQTYMDSIGDVEHRNSISYDADFRYINGSGRNDFAYAQVSQDEDNLYFLVKCAQDIIVTTAQTG